MRFSKAVVKYKIPILIVMLLLMIPAVIGMVRTRVNYDMLDYLPETMDTVKGQQELLDEFGKGGFSLVIVEDMPDKDVAAFAQALETLMTDEQLRCRMGRAAQEEVARFYPEHIMPQWLTLFESTLKEKHGKDR
jgi:predicted RND superfamily exporter protein